MTRLSDARRLLEPIEAPRVFFRYELSTLVWRAGQAIRAAIDDHLRRATFRGASGQEVARELEQYLSPSWSGKRDERGRLERAQPRRVANPGLGAGYGSYPVRRLARTQLSAAFETEGLESARLNPFVAGRKWNLSGTHKDADECDQLARDHSDLMPPGVYRLDEFPPCPYHTQCRCFGTNHPAEPEGVISSLREEIRRESF